MLQCSERIDQQDETMNFSERIRALLKVKTLSQRDLAAQTGINFTYISRIENSNS